MPNYGDLPGGPGATGQPATALQIGDRLNLFNAEQPAQGQASIACAPSPTPDGSYRPMVFDIEFAAVPAGNLLIQAASVDVDSAYQTVYTSAATQQDYYVDQGSFKFYRAKNSTSNGGGNLTVTITR